LGSSHSGENIPEQQQIKLKTMKMTEMAMVKLSGGGR
jgi:hypothetical protein